MRDKRLAIALGFVCALCSVNAMADDMQKGWVAPISTMESLEPYGTELTHRAAAVVFEWLCAPDRFGLHGREGQYAQNEEDWAALLDFSDHYFFGKSTDRKFDAWTYPDAELPFDWKAPGL